MKSCSSSSSLGSIELIGELFSKRQKFDVLKKKLLEHFTNNPVTDENKFVYEQAQSLTFLRSLAMYRLGFG